jgi:hypothetical protein
MREHIRGKAFRAGEIFEKRQVLEVISESEKLNDWIYRVKNLTCGHESVITHATFRRHRPTGSSGVCNACQAAKNAKKRPASTAGRKPREFTSRTQRFLPEESQEAWAMRLFNKVVRPQNLVIGN